MDKIRRMVLDGIGHISNFQTVVWPVLTAIITFIWSYVSDLPGPIIFVLTLGAISFTLTIFGKIHKVINSRNNHTPPPIYSQDGSTTSRLSEDERKEYARFVHGTIIPTHDMLTAFLNDLLRDIVGTDTGIACQFSRLFSKYVIGECDDAINKLKSAVDSGKDTEAVMINFYEKYILTRGWVVRIPQSVGALDGVRATEKFEEFAKLDDKFFDGIKDFTIVRPTLRENTIDRFRGMNIRTDRLPK